MSDQKYWVVVEPNNTKTKIESEEAAQERCFDGDSVWLVEPQGVHTKVSATTWFSSEGKCELTVSYLEDVNVAIDALELVSKSI